MDTPRPPSLSDLLDADWRALMLNIDPVVARRRTRNLLSPRFAPVVLIRVAASLHARGWPRLAKVFSLLNFVVFGLEVPARLKIGPGLVITHTHGTVLGAREIGACVTIYQQVTLGARVADFAFTPALRPLVQDHVTLTAGAKVLGPVTLGHHCTVGANAVVLEDVPPHALAVGVPARCVASTPSEVG